jgi:hypothetical protein
VKGPFGVDCLVGLKHAARSLDFGYFRPYGIVLFRRSLSCWIVCFAGVVTFCEAVLVGVLVGVPVIINIDCPFLLANSDMTLFAVHRATKYT